ncbi:MFS transporter [Sinomonas humi]|uniref:MFS transporter permease n=1 Tax=Sinomonas humi TaxID=1338436 RepID=A0A0B2ADX5_9MICC|nr:MFS transporter [Sinomonas humi]KHL01415.1 MFS transporter permease [Sinomonas humi]
MPLDEESTLAAPAQAEMPVAQRSTKIRWYGGAIIFIICFVAYLDRIVFSVSASPIMAALHISPVQFGLATTVFNIGYFVCQIPSAVLIRRVGTRRAMTIAFLAWSVCTGATGLANSFLLLAVVRTLFGAGEAPVFPAANSFFADWFPSKERGRANSLMNAGAFLGPALGAVLLVPIIQALGWRAGFFICTILGFILTAVWYLFMRDRPSQHRLVNAAEIDLIARGSDTIASPERAPWGLFLRKRSFWALALGFFGTLWTIQFFIYWLPYYLQKGLHVPFGSIGGFTSISFIAITISVMVAGVVSDKLLTSGRRRYQARNLVAVAGLAIAAVCLVMSTTSQNVLVSVIWLSAALGGAGVAQTLAWTIATDIGRAYTAAVGSWMNAWGFVAAAIVPTVAPIIAQQFGWTNVIVLNAAMAVAGIVGFLLTTSDRPLVADQPTA